ncbi:hypothetical protein [Palleronia sp.]|uniref:hypothetical protein n=1 Tax=Palleronia sp. TaxID=1940284 RepID=UPI0035C7B3C8
MIQHVYKKLFAMSRDVELYDGGFCTVQSMRAKNDYDTSTTLHHATGCGTRGNDGLLTKSFVQFHI